MASRRISSIPWDSLLLLGVYFTAGKLGLTLAFVHASATPVWPPTGIAFAAFLLRGYRVWPAILLGAFLVNLTTAGSVGTSVGIAVGNTLEGLLGAALVQRFAGGRRVFERAQDVLKFVGLAGLLSTALSATVGVTTLSLGGYASWTGYWAIWLTWWLGDVAGDLIVAPVLVLWSTGHARRLSRARAWEFALLLGTVAFAGGTVFNGLFSPWVRDYPIEFLCIPLLVLAAFRFGQREAATCIALLSGIAVWGTLQGFGPFVRETPNESLLLLQAFMGTLAVMTLPLAAVVAERGRAEEALARVAAIVSSSDDAIVGKTLDGVITSWNASAERLYGYAAPEAIGRPIAIMIPPERGAELSGILDKLRRGEQVAHYETVRVRKDGTRVDVSVTVSPTRDPQGRIVGASSIARDVTPRKAAEAAVRDRDRLRDVASLAAAAAHEINNPLAVIMGYVQLLDLDREVVTRHRRHMAELLDAVVRVQEIVARMKRITRIELADGLGSLPPMLDLRKSSAEGGGQRRSGQQQEP